MNQPQYTVDDLLYLMARLRDPDTGCPWDIKQDYASIAPSTIEEAYEVVDAIEKQDFAHLNEELGDLLFQVIFYTRIGKEEARWETIKQLEREAKGKTGLLDDVPVNLPSLTRATKLQKRAASVGFDWDDIQGPIAKVREELVEVEDALAQQDAHAVEEEVGDLLFAVVNITRYLKIDAEAALRAANRKFEQRFQYMEQQSARPLAESSMDDMNRLWDEAKKID